MTYQAQSPYDIPTKFVRPDASCSSIQRSYFGTFAAGATFTTCTQADRGASASAGRESVSPATSVPVTTAVRARAEKKRALDMKTLGERGIYPHSNGDEVGGGP